MQIERAGVSALLQCTPTTNRMRIVEKSARIWSSLNGPFDIAKQNP